MNRASNRRSGAPTSRFGNVAVNSSLFREGIPAGKVSDFGISEDECGSTETEDGRTRVVILDEDIPVTPPPHDWLMRPGGVALRMERDRASLPRNDPRRPNVPFDLTAVNCLIQREVVSRPENLLPCKVDGLHATRGDAGRLEQNALASAFHGPRIQR